MHLRIWECTLKNLKDILWWWEWQYIVIMATTINWHVFFKKKKKQHSSVVKIGTFCGSFHWLKCMVQIDASSGKCPVMYVVWMAFMGLFHRVSSDRGTPGVARLSGTKQIKAQTKALTFALIFLYKLYLLALDRGSFFF